MNREQTLDHFELQQDGVSNDQVEAIAAVEAHTLVHHRQGSLSFELDASFSQLGADTGLVGRFHEPWAEMSMHLDQRTDRLLRTIPKSPSPSALPPFLCHPRRRPGCRIFGENEGISQ